jgi:predicted acylesterase/phospholipase RssA
MSRDSDIAQSILRGESAPSAAEMWEIASGLKREKNFTLARRILNRAMLELGSGGADRELRVKIRQQAALCTYKDTDLPADTRLDRALDILSICEDVSDSTDQETLGIAGAIYKRKWEIDSQRQQLERSLFYYLRGYARGAPEVKPENIFSYLREQPPHMVSAKDRGYTGINAAFVLDQLAHLEEKGACAVKFDLDIAREKRQQARLIREEIIRTLEAMEPELRKKVNEKPEKDGKEPVTAGAPALDWWFYATLGEAYFGVGDYDKAKEWLIEKGSRVPDVADWEFESTARQLAMLARLQAKPGEDISEKAKQVLRLNHNEQALESTLQGKIGLGLSGGGFRASLYHIGVLARLAELDVLRRVEVFSCVSGGSIIGAQYYLEVRKLLESKHDETTAAAEGEHKNDDVIRKEDYIKIVRKLERDFLKGVQKNIRTRIAAQFIQNLLMIFTKRYSRTKRAGDLYERHLFSLVKDGHPKNEPRYLSDLRITPKGYDGSKNIFSPKNDNWRRRAKVPILILNAATLNTGHSWHFTATYMGEPPLGIDSDIDGNDNYRRMWYYEAPEGFKQVPLGHAVAASACVQGVFEPLTFEGLYPDRTVRLVDGGTCDNQGVGGLLEQDCNVILISDGSGQMETQNHPSPGLLGVPLRSVDIVQARVRAAQYNELSARRRSGLLRGFMFVHLKGDLDVDPVDWVDCQDPFEASDDARPIYRRGPLTRYGIAKAIQRQLAAIRTDLDSFSDVEAYALMTSGYRMTEQAFREGCIEGFGRPKKEKREERDVEQEEKKKEELWNFLQVEKGMRVPNKEYRHVQRLLGVSPSKAFKVWMLSKWLKALAVLLAVAAVAGVVFLFFRYSNKDLVKNFTLGSLGLALLSYILTKVATLMLGKNVMKVIQFRSTLIRVALGIGLALFGTLVAGLHLIVFDRLFLRFGGIKKFNELAAAEKKAREQKRPAGKQQPVSKH